MTGEEQRSSGVHSRSQHDSSITNARLPHQLCSSAFLERKTRDCTPWFDQSHAGKRIDNTADGASTSCVGHRCPQLSRKPPPLWLICALICGPRHRESFHISVGNAHSEIPFYGRGKGGPGSARSSPYHFALFIPVQKSTSFDMHIGALGVW